MTRVQAIPGLTAATYVRHELHADERLWVEKNCYVDVVIEMLHALGLEPLAALGFCAAVDFEGDNFTFFKPSHDDLRTLFGVDFQELNVWRPLLEHAVHHLADHKFISTEVDSFFLPDTVATDYRRNHVKTTIILADVDVDRRRLGYFHNAAYHELSGEDFEQVFAADAPGPGATALPFFAELIRIDRMVARPRVELTALARELLQRHLGWRPARNPIDALSARFGDDLQQLQAQGLDTYHRWAFGNLRQLGAAFELLALHLRWLHATESRPGYTRAADEFMRLSGAAKTLILKGARAVNSRKPLDASALFSDMAEAWANGQGALAHEIGAFTASLA